MKKLYLFLVALTCSSQFAMSQTATGTITQVPCNNDGIYSISTSGIPLPITYTYYVNGTTTVHANVNSATDQLTNIPMSNSGGMSCQVSSGGQTYWTQDGYTPSFIFEVFATNPTCPATMGTLQASFITGTTGPFSYEWTNTQTQTVYTGNNASAPVGSYSAEITDLTSGCVSVTGDSMLYIQQISGVTASISTVPASCTNGSATAVASGGVAPYTYLWANGATTPANTGLSQGFYPLTVTDAQGCHSNNLGAYIGQNPQIIVNLSPTPSTCQQNDGSIIAFGSGGVGPYTYAWSNGQTGNTATNLAGATYYSVVATDANGCVGTSGTSLSASTPINVSLATAPSQCTSATGSATITPTGGTTPYSYQWFSNPSVTGATITGVAPGNYAFRVTDAAGCVRNGSAVVPPVSTINANAYSSTVICPATTGNVTAVASGSNAPFTYLWSNAATTSSISGVPIGGYSVKVTDALGCSVTKYASLSSLSPVNVGVTTTPATCIYNTDGAVSSVVSGGTSPYSYAYSNGTTTANAGSLGVNSYNLTVTDANGCSTSKYFVIADANTSDNCYCTISGTVFVDGDADCTFDSGESGVENIMMHCSGQGYAFTDANGEYSFRVPTGTYTISEQINQYYPLSLCQPNGTSVTVTAASGCTNVVNFSNSVIALHDLKIVTVSSSIPPVPGNNYQQKIIVKNEGTISESGIQLGYEHDGQLPFLNATLPSFVNSAGNPDHYGVQSGFPSLTPNSAQVILLNYYTPTTIPMGTQVVFNDSVAQAAPIVTNWLLDNTPWNNVNTFSTTVISSYDPNYKEVSPKGSGEEGYVPTATKEFDYTIHFQNEGTYYAQNIYVTDQLDADFDWTTFRPGYSDHEYSATVSETGLVTFTFPDINLPWKSQFGNALSSGLVSYSIQRKPTTPVGTEFTNFASIYFDYNAPIITNTTINTLDQTFGLDDLQSGSADGITVDLFPVPAGDNLTIRINNVLKSGAATVSILDLTGKVVLSRKISLNEGTTAVNNNLSGLRTGTYLTRIEFENGSSIVKKIVVANN